MEYTYRYASPLGAIFLTGDGEALTGLRFEGELPPAELLNALKTNFAHPVFADAVRWLDLYFSGEEPDFTPALRLKGTAFQRTVWDLLRTVPYGQTVSYGALAQRAAARLGQPRMSAQAVGGAVGRNPVALIVPCHRVLGADGGLTGYAWGLDRKRRLLELEGSGAGRGDQAPF